MNIFNKVTLKTLRKNRTRTIVTIIGIILSASMICAVTTSVSSLQNFLLKTMIYERGDWHGSSACVNKETLDKVAASDKIEKLVYQQNIGYSKVDGITNKSKPYLFVIGASTGYQDTMPVYITSGSYPKSSDEILIPEHLYSNGGVQYKLGDKITLGLGKRMLDGLVLNQYNQFQNSENNESGEVEKLIVNETRSYTVVGFYERPSFESFLAPGYTAITLADKTTAAESTYDIYFKMVNPKNVYNFMKENDLGVSTNTDVLMFLGVARYDSFYSVLYGLASIVMILIMFGSISLIYNAFSISVSERTKQFGLLSSIGATKKQLRRSVLFEALSVSVIGIPLGILFGIGGMGTTLLLISDKFASFTSHGGASIPMRICVSPVSIVIACIVALLTVLISAWIPAKRATKVSAIEAIRQNADIQAKAKQIKTSKLMYKLFGLPGMLANKYFKRSRKKYRATIISLFMSIVLFVSASAFTGYLTESVEGSFASNGYDLMCYQSSGDVEKIAPEVLVKELGREEHIEKSAYTSTVELDSSVANSYINAHYLENYKKSQEDAGVTVDDLVHMTVYVSFIDDASYQGLLTENGLQEQDYMNKDQPLAIAIDGNRSFNYGKEKFTKQDVLKSDNSDINIMGFKEIPGYICRNEYDTDDNSILIYRNVDDENDVIKVPADESTNLVNLRTGKIIYENPYFVESRGDLTLLYPYSLASTVLSKNELSSAIVQHYFISSDHAASYTAMDKMLQSHNLNSTYLFDYAENAQQNRNIITILNVFAYGFIVLISLITVANVFNTVSTNISLRRREFAMLKSVGMTRGGFNRMMNFECLLYGTRALLAGLPVSVMFTYLIFRAISQGYQTEFNLPWNAIGITVLSVFVVVFATMMYSMRKVKTENPIDALKNENL